MKRFLSFSFLFLLALIPASICYYGLMLYNTSYDEFINHTLKSIQREDLKEILSKNYFPLSKYHIVLKVVWILGILSATSLLLLFRYFYRLKQFVERGVAFAIQLFRNQLVTLKEISDRQKTGLVLILLFVLMRSIYYATHFYIQYDEAWNYNYFLRKNILLTLFAYNNYPLHNIITFLFLKIVPDGAFFMRLPVIFLGLASCLSIFIITRKIFNGTWIALMSSLLFASLPVSIYYMLFARGVMLNVFFLIWSFYAGWRMIHSSGKRYPLLLIILNILGTASIISHPVFILIQGSLAGLFLVLKGLKTPLNQIVKGFALSIAGSILVLTPFLMGSGINTFKSGGSSLAIKYDIPYHSYSAFYSGAWWGFYVLVILHLFFLLTKELKAYRYIIWLNVLLLASIPLIHFVFGNYPPERALPYLILPVVTGFIMLCHYLSSYPGFSVFIGFSALALASFQNYYTYRSKYMQWSKELDHQVFILSEKLDADHVHSIYSANTDFNYFVPGLTYYSYLKGNPITYYTNQPESTRYKPSMFDSTDAIVYNIDTSLHYRLIFKLDSMAVYLKR